MSALQKNSSSDETYNCKMARFVSEEEMLGEFVKTWHGGSVVNLLAEATAVKREYSMAIEEIFDELSKGAIRNATEREKVFLVAAMALATVGIALERKRAA